MSEEKACSICSDVAQEVEFIKLIDCQHEFHRNCIFKWH